MTKFFETGHISNISNFKKVLDICSNFGPQYVPSNEQIKINRLRSLWMHANAEEVAFQNAMQNCRPLLREREAIFSSLGKTITKIYGLVGSLNESVDFKSEVKKMADKIRGFYRLGDLQKSSPAGQRPEMELSYAQRTANFQLLLQLLHRSKCYAPNEAELQLSHLQSHHDYMHVLNQKIAMAQQTLLLARQNRDHAIYHPQEGLLAMVKACKSYVKGLYGADSEAHRSLCALKFRQKSKKNNFQSRVKNF